MKRNLLLFIIILLGGCAAVSPALPVIDSPAGLTTDAMPSAPVDGALALSADGVLLARSYNGLELQHLDGTRPQRLSQDVPDSLCWSFDDSRLAAGFHTADGGLVQIFDRQGVLQRELRVDGRIARLRWTREGLWGAVISRRDFSFGSRIKAHLVRFDEKWERQGFKLYETTITPATLKRLQQGVYRSFDFDISPFGDEILYSRLYAPPAFGATRQLVLHHLLSGAEHQIATLPLRGGRGLLADDGETALIDDGQGVIRRQRLWGKQQVVERWSGEGLDYVAGRRLLLAGNRFYLDGKLQFVLPAGSHARFAAGGRFLLVDWQNHRYFVRGYVLPDRSVLPAEKVDKLRQLRRLRSRELIDNAEFQRALKRLLP